MFPSSSSMLWSIIFTWRPCTWPEKVTPFDGATPFINSTLYGSRRALTVFSQRQFHGEQKARVLSLVGEQWRPVDGYSRVVQNPCRAWHHPSRQARVATYGSRPAASSTATGRRLCSSTCDLYPGVNYKTIINTLPHSVNIYCVCHDLQASY